ncbi:hypothetical protein CRUP_011701 [Coryphaenoides rupestris]|nr:hypothetical protein CRUP_011701 [Coryphaenoides rupestris]
MRPTREPATRWRLMPGTLWSEHGRAGRGRGPGGGAAGAGAGCLQAPGTAGTASQHKLGRGPSPPGSSSMGETDRAARAPGQRILHVLRENCPPTNEDCCAFGSYLGTVDPWYDCNIRSLGVTIPELAKKHTNMGQKESLLSDVISYYVRLGRQPVYFSIYKVTISFCCLDKVSVEQVFLSHLEMEFPEFKRISHSVREKQWKNMGGACGAVVSMNYKRVTLSGRDVDTGLSVNMFAAQITAIPSNEMEGQKVRTCDVKISSPEKRPIEISPCLDPCYCLHKSRHGKPGGPDDNAGLSKYLNRGLPLAINTFSGIIN